MTIDNKKCPVCNSILSEEYSPSVYDPEINCQRCGNFSLDHSWNSSIKTIFSELRKLNPKERANCSGLIRESQIEGTPYFLTINKIDSLKNNRHPHIFEKADKLLLHFDQNSEYAGKWLDYSKKQEELMGVSWAIQGEDSSPYRELHYLLNDYLWYTKKFLMFPREGQSKNNSNPGQFWNLSKFCITPLGHEYIQTLKQTIVNSNQGFCAMWFGGKENREEYDALWEKAIKPAIESAGYDPQRIDKKEHTNDINDEMLMEIRRSKFVVCDFNKECHGAYFEAGFAKGLNLPVIWTCKKESLDKKDLHFDVDHYNFIGWEDGNLEDFRNKLHKRIEAILGRGKNFTTK